MKQLKETETTSYIQEQELEETKSIKDGPLLQIKNLKTYFYTEEGVVKAVDGVSFDMYEDETLGLVGETGCGKSVTALSILRLVRAPGKILEGSVSFKGEDLLDLSEKDMRTYRGKEITMIFQDPLNSLNPVMTVGKQISEVFFLHQNEEMKQTLDKKILERKKSLEEIKRLKLQLANKEPKLSKEEKKEQEEEIIKEAVIKKPLSEEEKKEIAKRIAEIKKKIAHIPNIKDVALEKAARIVKEVGIADAEDILKRYPHELSGGMRQRTMIAMALSCNPSLLIADEPTTALDVTIQAQILDLMKELKIRFRTSILLITHDLGIIADMCDRVAVMYSGNIVEYATALDLFKNPRHPYTKGLISAIPSIEKRDTELQTIRGMVPNLIYPPSGCRFHPRCDFRLEICDKIKPILTEIGDKYFVACHLFDPKYKDSPKYDWNKEEL
ncbi:MAG: ABC transporter ATP-binding protein [Candidatus Thorarchaeota archaeon]